jgi:hypothetical protein
MHPLPPTQLSLHRRLAGYAFFIALSIGILAAGLRLDRADLRAPFNYQGDALLILPMVKATLEQGSHWRTDRLGAPGVQELHDFPVVDHLHFGMIWLLGRVWSDPVVVFNLFHLLTYPLTVLTAMVVGRQVGLSIPAAGCAAILFAFLPYHQVRGQGHYFLAAYYVVPLTCLLVFWLVRGRLPFFRPEVEGYRFAPWSRDGLAAVVLAALTASSGAYYAFFGCAFLVLAGVSAAILFRSWRALASTGLVIALIVVGGILNHAPAIIHQFRYGANPAPHARQPEEAEEYGLKLTHLLLPISGHNSRVLARIQSAYDSPERLLQNENRTATLGLVGSAGFLALLGTILLPVRKGWPLGPLAVLTLFGTLLGTIGGLGAIFAEFVSPQVRAYNRVAVYLAYFALLTACWLPDRILLTRFGWSRWLHGPVFLSLVALGVWDQTGQLWFRPAVADERDRQADAFRADADFFARVEESYPQGAIFMLPFVPYPETFAVGKLSGYDHARGYLHTRTVRWSFGAMKGREVDQWQREVATARTPDLVRRLVVMGFDGVFVDRRGYPPGEAERLLTELTIVLWPAPPRIDHPDGNQVVLDLRPYRSRMRLTLGPRYEALARAERETVRVLWLGGFVSFEPVGQEDRHRWCGPEGVAQFVNPTDRPRTVRLDLLLRTMTDEPADLRIEGGSLWSERFPVDRSSQPISRILTVPPGRHEVRFRCRMPAGSLPREGRRLSFFVAEFRMTEVESAPSPRRVSPEHARGPKPTAGQGSKLDSVGERG